MVRAEIRLTDEQAARLEQLATEEGVSIEELIQQGIELVLRSPQELRSEAWRRAVSASGRYRSKKGDLSARHDDYFAEAVDP